MRLWNTGTDESRSRDETREGWCYHPAGAGLRRIVIVTGVLVLEPVAEAGEGDDFFSPGETFPEEGGRE